jgi:hypothetical protein
MASNSTIEIELAAQMQSASAATLTDVELLPHGAETPTGSEAGHSLPPTDGGKDAWLFLFSCFMLEAMIWGALDLGSYHTRDSC